MSFGGGFGANNNSTFGGFGAANTNTGFGGNNASSGGGLFGGNTATSGGFGTGGGGGGFGSTNTSSPFGAKPASGGFGSTATTTGGGGLFGGGGTATSGGFGGGGGFGSTNTASTGFGATNTNSGGLFGANKPATGFGSTNTGSIFGGGTNTSTGFGANAAAPASNPFGGTATTASTGFGATNTNTGTGFGGGFGATNNAQTNGTGSTPFSAFQEKDGATNQTSHYQSITFQQPYINKSFEELRVEDYLQGRRYGNTNGQAGSFGTSTGFGGSLFGGNNTSTPNTTTSSGGLFGSNTATTTSNTGFGGGFGANNTATQQTGGFGSNTTGGLFGAQNKPAGGGLFGNANTTGAGFGNTASTGGGLFGSNNTSTNTGFGANTATTTGGGLFGANTQQQNKPAFGGFGATATTTNTGFGQNNTNTGGGLFGSTTNTNTNTSGGLFGGNNNAQPQQQNSNPFGGNTSTSGGLFGAQQNKPAGGLFGNTTTNTNTGGGLFGSNSGAQQQSSGGLFGSTNNTGGGLFGANNQNKPASGGLFGSTTTNNNASGGLFGSTSQPTNTGGGLFGSTNNNSGGGSLFGNTQNKPAGGGGLFGNASNNNNNSGGGLFGSTMNNQSQPNNSGNSLFGSTNNPNQGGNSLFGSLSQSQNQNQQNQLHASLTLSPYGNDQLFSSLGQSSAPVGPLATPLAGARPTPSKTPSLLSSTRLNSPIYTPRASTLGRASSFGFSYSTYGTPGSAYSSSLTPQASSLLKPTGSLGSALSSRLAKSMSMNNLRGLDGTPPRESDSLLRPTPGSASSRYLNSGSMRKLTIDRNLRTDLFSPPSQLQRVESAADVESPGLKKKVSFNSATDGPNQTNAEPSGQNALIRTEADEDDASPVAPRSQSRSNGAPEMEQVDGAKSLAGIPEDAEPYRLSSAPNTKKAAEKIPAPFKDVHIGAYWCEPSLKNLKNMSRTQLSNLGKFTVGREGIGKIEFFNVDLTSVDIDNIFDDRDMEERYEEKHGGKSIVQLKVRSATVYPKDATKPPRGQGLNVPSRIYLENSWPRSHGGRKAVLAKSGPAFDKHVNRFKSIKGTKFVDYVADTGVWIFEVDHFTTYGLDEDGESLYTEEGEDMDGVQQDSSGLSEPPPDDTMQSIETVTNTGDVDDTFEFKLNRSKSSLRSSHIPGEFDKAQDMTVSYDYDDPSADESVEEDTMMSGGLDRDDVFSTLPGVIQASSHGAHERPNSSTALESPGADDIAEDTQVQELPGSFNFEEPKMLRSILKPTAAASLFTIASPEKLAKDSWEEQLQRTMSPKKRDRQALRDLQQSALRHEREGAVESPFKRSMLGQSMLGQSYLAQKSAKKVGFGASTFGGNNLGPGKSEAFRTSMDLMNSLWAQEKTSTRSTVAKGFENPYPKKPRPSGPAEVDDNETAFHDSMKPRFANNGTLVYSALGLAPRVDGPLESVLAPIVSGHKEVRFARFSRHDDTNPINLTHQKSATKVHTDGRFPCAKVDSAWVSLSQLSQDSTGAESSIWQLSAVLFDPLRQSAAHLVAGMSDEQISEYEIRLRRDVFVSFWSQLVSTLVDEQLPPARSAEEKALLLLTKNDVIGAAEMLVKAKDFRLATLISQLPGSEDSRGLMQAQIEAWRNRSDWSEMSPAVRALYSLLTGETCVVAGKNGPKEDRVAELNIAEHFNLHWMQSFALRVFFGGYSSLDQAVKAYAGDLESGRETIRPLPWWANGHQGAEAAAGKEDTLLSILRLFSTTRAYPADLEALFDPKTISGSATNTRLAWQLATILSAKGWTDYLPKDKYDQLTRDFAAELENASKFVSATWVLLHMTDVQARELLVRELLMRNGGHIPEPLPMGGAHEQTEPDVFRYLSQDNQIPELLLWEAKALYAKAELKNPYLQTDYLLTAQLYDQAHEVVCQTIGPMAVIEEEYHDLAVLLGRFSNASEKPVGWESGGQVFDDFTRMCSTPAHRKNGREWKGLVEKLRSGLEAMQNSTSAVHMTLEGRVAMVEMERKMREEARDAEVGARDGRPMEGVVGAKVEVPELWMRYRAAMAVVT